MIQAIKQWMFRLLGKDAEAVVVSFLTGDPSLTLPMVEEIRKLEPERRHFVVAVGAAPEIGGATVLSLPPGSAWRLYWRLRREFRQFRIGLMPVMLGDPACRDLRRAAFLLAPTKILAYNNKLDRFHLKAKNPLPSLLFASGVPRDRIFLKPGWLFPFKRDVSWIAKGDDYQIHDGRPFSPKRRRIAVLTPYFPYPLSHGGAVRMYNLLRELSREFDVMLLSFGERVKGEHLPPVQQFCAKTFLVPATRYREPRWSTLLPPEVCEYRSELMGKIVAWVRNEFKAEVVQVEYTSMASYPGDILVEHDVTVDLFRQIHEREQTWMSRFNLWRWERFEKPALRRFRRVIAMSRKDAAMIGLDTVRVVPNGVDLKRFQPEPERPGQRLLFVGSFRHFPNIRAYQFFTGEVWPRIRDRFPEMTLTVVAGPDPGLYWQAHAGTLAPPVDDRIQILGMTRDVRPLLAGANVVVVPTTVSAGTNLKVIEAMAMQRAVVSTPSGCAGLDLEHGRNIWVAGDAASFAEGIATLLTDAALRARIAASAREVAQARFGWEAIGELQRGVIRELLPERYPIRAAAGDDLPAIRRIQEQAPEASHWEASRYLVYDACVALAGGRIAGFIVCRKTASDESEVLNLAVDPDFRRQGVATALIRAALARAGTGEFFLEVRESNQPARDLYRKLGFEEAGVRPGYYSDPAEAAIVMRLRSC